VQEGAVILQMLAGGIVVGDGGSLFELERRGYASAGPFLPQAVVEQPEAVRQMQTDFARAGAQVLQACTYYAHERKLRDLGLEGALEEINRGAVRIARDVARGYGALVAGNLANTWVYDPADPGTHRETRRQFDRQIESQEKEGTDFIIAETIMYRGEARIALEAIKAAGKTAMVTMGFKGRDTTLDGASLEDAFKELEGLGADIVGLNCFRDPPRMLPLARRVKEAVSCPVAVQPAAFRCSDERPYFQALRFQGRAAFPLELDPFLLTRVEMADYALKAREMGIGYIGGCCGTAPHHLRAMAEALGRTVPASRYSPRLELHPLIRKGM
jgi:betaine-homocysteine S-methyltransferase